MATANEYELIGTVVLAQIHTDHVVDASGYNVERIKPVEELWATPDGLIGLDGAVALVDGHHRYHPNKHRGSSSRRFTPERLVSIGFTSHYRVTEVHFGWSRIGAAGENIIVESSRPWSERDLAGGVRIGDRSEGVDVSGFAVAKPCVSYTRFMMGNATADGAELKRNMAFLDDGLRGFVAGIDTPAQKPIMVGDQVWRLRG